VMVFVQKIAKIIQVVTAFIDSIVAIAAGNIGAASKRVESILAGLLSLAISFLAGFAGLGKIADKIMGVIAKVRAPIDKALDALIAWIVKMAKSLFSKVFGKDKKDERTPEQKAADVDRGLSEAEGVLARPNITEGDARKALPAIKAKHKLTELELVVESVEPARERIHFEAAASPGKKSKPSFIKTVGGVITEIVIRRPSGFRAAVARTVNPGNLDLLKAKLDRCHVVSSSDMAKHYESTLKGKTWAEAVAILTPKVTVEPPQDEGKILAAARKLHRDFFNVLENLFLDEAWENRAIGARPDPRHPAIQRDKAKLDAHVARMAAKWALGPFTPST
jgi:hypothetical protein